MSWSFKSHARTGQSIVGHDDTGIDDNPAGGYVQDGFTSFQDNQQANFQIRWQNGPLDREGGVAPNGAFVEDVLESCKRRLEFYQESNFACDANATAIGHIEEAIGSLLTRRDDREARGVQGKNEK